MLVPLKTPESCGKSINKPQTLDIKTPFVPAYTSVENLRFHYKFPIGSTKSRFLESKIERLKYIMNNLTVVVLKDSKIAPRPHSDLSMPTQQTGSVDIQSSVKPSIGVMQSRNCTENNNTMHRYYHLH